MKYIVVEAALPNMNSRKRLVHVSTSSPRPTRVSRQVEEHTGLFEENYTLSLETRPPIDATMQIVRGRIGSEFGTAAINIEGQIVLSAA